jgi:hypothetical protein
VEARELGLACSASSAFRGEVHFESAATYLSFLRDECLIDADDNDVDAALADVDFSSEAVFFASGTKDQGPDEPCLNERRFGQAQVCQGHLRVFFDDDFVAAGESCVNGAWFMAIAMPRGELRAALED